MRKEVVITSTRSFSCSRRSREEVGQAAADTIEPTVRQCLGDLGSFDDPRETKQTIRWVTEVPAARVALAHGGVQVMT